VHGHFADAGYVAANIAGFFGLPLVFTGHSLGRNKLEKLLQDGMSRAEINRKFFMHQRLEAEEDILRSSDLVITSTRQEIELQYGLYTNRDLPRYLVVPPGVDIEKFTPYSEHLGHDHLHHPLVAHARASLHDSLNRFLTHPEKPLILAICRPEKRKNISGLIKAYGEDKTLQAIANLAIFAGIRKDISDKEENERDVLTDMLLLMDYYDYTERWRFPKNMILSLKYPSCTASPQRKKVFSSMSPLTEPFGLTLIEASACGLPIVATNDGGPRDIVANCKNGVLVDPLDHKAITRAIRGMVTDNEVWKKYSLNGMVNVRTHYTWAAHCESYIHEIRALQKKARPASFAPAIAGLPIGKRLTRLERLLVTDIDNTLLGADNSALDELVSFLKNRHEHIGSALPRAHVTSALEVLQQHGIPNRTSSYPLWAQKSVTCRSGTRQGLEHPYCHGLEPRKN
jgi:sucrose-phosphate synthase